MHKLFRLTIALTGVVALSGPAAAQMPSTSVPRAVAAPVLKWAYGGCAPSDCQTGWYSSPAVADLNGDGQPEVI